MHVKDILCKTADVLLMSISISVQNIPGFVIEIVHISIIYKILQEMY